MSWFCKHQWEKVSDQVLPSAWEQYAQVNAGSINKMGKASIPVWMFQKSHILVLKCTLCGKLDKTVTRNI